VKVSCLPRSTEPTGAAGGLAAGAAVAGAAVAGTGSLVAGVVSVWANAAKESAARARLAAIGTGRVMSGIRNREWLEWNWLVHATQVAMRNRNSIATA
jgi:hypothetical protein